MLFWQCAFGLSPSQLHCSRSQTSLLKGQRPRPHMHRYKQDSMPKRWVGAPHFGKPPSLRHRCNYRDVRGHRDNSMKSACPPYWLRGKYSRFSIIFLGKQARHVDRARRVWWRTWVVYTLRVDTVIILLNITNITSNIHLDNQPSTITGRGSRRERKLDRLKS